MRFAVPLCVFFLWSDPLWSYGTKPGFAGKQFSNSEKMLFFRTCLGCFQSTQNPYVDRLGDLKYSFPKNLMKTALPRIEPATPPTVPTPPFTAATVFCLKGPAPWSCCWFAARSPVCSKKHIFFFCGALMKHRQARLCKKKHQALKNCFFVCILSNLPTPPRYLALARSKLRRCIQYITKNDLRIWGTLGLKLSDS